MVRIPVVGALLCEYGYENEQGQGQRPAARENSLRDGLRRCMNRPRI